MMHLAHARGDRMMGAWRGTLALVAADGSVRL